jgi:hypothetical protein
LKDSGGYYPYLQNTWLFSLTVLKYIVTIKQDTGVLRQIFIRGKIFMETNGIFTFDQALEFFGRSVGALLIVDETADSYQSLVRRGIFLDILSESSSYTSFVQTLWFHHNDDGRKITETYMCLSRIWASLQESTASG